MAALTKDTPLDATARPQILSYPVADNVKIYKGSIVCRDTNGYANIGANTAGFTVLGIADEQIDNTLTGHTAGGKRIKVQSDRVFRKMTAAGMAQSSVGKPAYVTDSGTVGLSATNSVLVGVIIYYNSATSVDVFIPTPLALGIGETAGVNGVGPGYVLARGQMTTVTASDTVVTGVGATLVSAVANLESAPVLTCASANANIGTQAGAPAAGSILITTWMPTSNANPTPIAATTFSKLVNWMASS